MLVVFFAALAASMIALTFVQTFEAYPSVGDTFPLHLNWRGEASGYGPRWMIFFIPGLQLFVTAMMFFSGYAIAMQAPGTHGTLTGLSIIAAAVAALTWRVQGLLIFVARSRKPAPMRGFWIFFAVWMLIVLGDAFLIG